jgi:hypothetical protein
VYKKTKLCQETYSAQAVEIQKLSKMCNICLRCALRMQTSAVIYKIVKACCLEYAEILKAFFTKGITNPKMVFDVISKISSVRTVTTVCFKVFFCYSVMKDATYRQTWMGNNVFS